MYVIRKWKPGQKKSPWALIDHEGKLIALFLYRKGARQVLEHLMERDKLRERAAGLFAIILEDTPDQPRLSKVADR